MCNRLNCINTVIVLATSVWVSNAGAISVPYDHDTHTNEGMVNVRPMPQMPFDFVPGPMGLPDSERLIDLSALRVQDHTAEVQPSIQAINDLIAGLKTQIELARRQDDQTMSSQAIQYLLASTDRMTRLVNQLLALSRNEPGAQGVIRIIWVCWHQM